MRYYSKTAWDIASRYSAVLASETRDLAGAIDKAIADENERLRAAATSLLAALDNMHERGETFTGRVSLSVANMRITLDNGLPTAEDVRGILRNGEQERKEK